MLGQVIQKLKQIEYERITLLAPVTIVDGRSYRRYIREYPDIYKNQISSAHTVFIFKLENASAEEREWLKAELECPERLCVSGAAYPGGIWKYFSGEGKGQGGRAGRGRKGCVYWYVNLPQ